MTLLGRIVQHAALAGALALCVAVAAQPASAQRSPRPVATVGHTRQPSAKPPATPVRSAKPTPSATATASTAATASPSPVPAANDQRVAADYDLAQMIWLSTLIAAVLGFAGVVWVRAREGPSKIAVTDKDLEFGRMTFGFWLIIGGLLLTLAVVLVTINHFQTDRISDVIAIISSVTGVIGTLTAAFFGIQAAGAGRSQALSALGDQLRAAASGAAAEYKLAPAVGPHAGNTVVTISGNDLTAAIAVNFGSRPGTHFQVTNDGIIKVTTPAVDLDENVPTQQGKSDVDVTIVFAPPVANRVAGKFYYYTLKPEWTDASQSQPQAPPKTQIVKSLNIYGTGLSGAASVQFGDADAIPVTAVSDSKIQIPYEKIESLKIWDTDVEVAVIFAADTATKRMVIGRFSIPPPTRPAPTVPPP